MRSAAVRIVIGAVLAALALVQPAAAHPHMFFASTAQFLLDAEGRLEKLRTVFLVDELNSLYTLTELGVNADGDQTLTEEEKKKVAEAVLEGFGHYDFFTKLSNAHGPVVLGKPEEVTVQLLKGRLGLSFVMPLQQPLALARTPLSLRLYDPTFFTAISIDRPPMIVGQREDCTVTVAKPDETDETRQSEQLLSQLSREETPEEEDIGVIFAETTTLQCQH